MRSRGLCGPLGATRFDHNDGFGEGDFARRRKKSSRVPDGLHVDDDAFCMRVVAKIIDQVAPINIKHGTDGDERAEANVLA